MKKKGTKKVKTSVSFSPEYLEIADQLAEREDRSRSYIMDRIMEEGLAAAYEAGVDNFAQGMAHFRKNLKKAVEKGRLSKRQKGSDETSA